MRCATKSPPSSFGLTKWVIPKRSPHCFFAGLISTPMIMSAPARRRPWMTLSPMPPSPKNDIGRAGLHLGRVENGADPRSDAAADVADLIEGSVLANLGDRDLG